MKKATVLVAFAALCAMLWSCGQKPKLSGEVDMPDGTMLQLISVTTNETLDTLKVEKGKFSYNGTAPDGIYSLVWEMQQSWTVELSATPFAIKASTKDSIPSQVTEGKDKDLINKYYEYESQYAVAMAPIQEAMQKAMQGNTPEAEAETMMLAAENARNTFSANLYQLASANPNNEFSLYLLQSTVTMLGYDQMLELDQALEAWDAAYAENATMQSIRKTIAKQKQLADGQPFVDLTAKTADGNEVALSSIAGKGHPVLLKFWASWCKPCRRSNPGLVKLYATYHPKGFEIFGVSLDEKAEDWQNAVAADNLTWPQYIAGWNVAMETYNVQGIPFTVLIDGEGKIVAKNLDENGLESKLEELLK